MKKAIFLSILLLNISTTGFSADYTYDVEGFGDNGYYYGEIESEKGDRDVEGYLYDEDGNDIYFEGEWVGKGKIEGYDENGNYIELEVD